MKNLGTLLILVFVGFVLGCSTITVSQDYDPEYDFSQLKTYDWLPLSEKEPLSDLDVRRVKDATNRVLMAKGYTASADTPDFLVAMHGGKQRRVDVVDWGYNWGWYGPLWGPGASRIDVYQYDEGTLTLDFVDAEKRQLVWRSSARAVISERETPQSRQEKITKTVTKMLEKFPPTE